MKIKVFTKYVGDRKPCFIIAEAGSNHNGSVELGKELIEKAKESGADAVKFQAFKTSELVTINANKANYQKGKSKGKSQYEMLKDLELTQRDHKTLIAHAKKNKIPIFHSVFDKKSTNMISKLGAKVFKIGSGEITNLPLIEHVAKKKKPLIISTGMSIMDEIREAVEAARSVGNNKIILMHCTTGYPSKLRDSNLRALRTLRERFRVPVGHSDHTKGLTAGVAAAALGASMLEKHFTSDKKSHGPDHSMSMDPAEFSELVQKVRKVQGKAVESNLVRILEQTGMVVTPNLIEKILGSSLKKPTKSELAQRVWARKSVVAGKSIRKGIKIKKSMLSIKRPGFGVEPKYLNDLVGRKAKVNIKKDSLVEWRMVE
jgi:N-acetylneuraminate synthase/N,N'-diacetyllegionaminate synthase